MKNPTIIFSELGKLLVIEQLPVNRQKVNILQTATESKVISENATFFCVAHNLEIKDLQKYTSQKYRKATKTLHTVS